MTEVDRRAATRPYAAPGAPTPPARPGPTFLVGEEAARARSFGLIIMQLCLLVLACVPCLGQAWPLDLAVSGALLGLGSVSAGCGIYAWRVRRYPLGLFRVHGAVAVLAALVIQYYLGVFSPTAVAVALGLAFFGQGNDGLTAWGIGVGAAGSYALLAALLTAGVVEDRGVFAAVDAPLAGKIFMMLVVPIVMLLTVAQARANRRATRALVAQVAEATREAEGEAARHREVAKELDAVRQAGVMQPGRWTGETLGGARLGGVLGRGATGEVYAAFDSAGNACLAVKVLRPGLLGDPVALARFEREGRIAAGLTSPHVVRVHGCGHAEDGTPFIVMDRAVGDDLGAVLREQARLPETEILRLMSEAAHPLAEAHQWGVVHRDIKPSNLLLAQEGGRTRWKLLDFGIAAFSGSDTTVTRQGEVVGTPNYMSPEQARGMPIDERSDLYSLGAVAYRALTGPVPHEAPTPILTLIRITEGRPKSPRSLAPSISPGMGDLLALLLAPEPELRVQSASELRALIDELRAHRGVEVRRRAARALAQSGWGA
ncbi:MAG: serine/threonine protein kinase [Deltaproteobacteria bacterium]|nr:serine/threonine protein kinase [Deltaproteobacteria bacterium]